MHLLIGLLLIAPALFGQIEFQGKSAKSKHIVLISGDEEYRSEESMPQLAKILSKHHRFRCTVLFAINPDNGEIQPDRANNIPGLEALATADLVVLALRFRDLPDAQMKHIDDYVESGKPIIALRTATHSFQIKSSPTYARYDWKAPDGGFGRRVLGETWIAHHGKHNVQSTRGILMPGQEKHPILRGVSDIWGPSDVYKVRLPLPPDSQPLVLGQVLTGMKPTDPPLPGQQNDPMMPVAWTKSYQTKNGISARVFTTTMGAAEDLLSEGGRRMLVNAIYWGLGMEKKIKAKSNVSIVGDYKPTHFSFGGYIKGRKPADYR